MFAAIGLIGSVSEHAWFYLAAVGSFSGAWLFFRNVATAATDP